MPKNVPDCPNKPKPSRDAIEDFEIELITPMFGGGVEAGVPDRQQAIRGTSIRGHLQFWWRATRGTSCATTEELFTRHSDIWGTTDRVSPIGVEIRDIRCAAPKRCAGYSPRNNGKMQLNWKDPFREPYLPYVLFPFQGQLTKDRRGVEEEPAEFIDKVSFVLRIRFPERLRPEVETAVAAWVNFGGLGARTRRGCGSLYCGRFAPKDTEQLRSRLEIIGQPCGVVRDWPTMPGSILIRPEIGRPIVVWDLIIGRFRHFRQGEGFARNRNQGRSHYPEPDTIRRITGRWSERHEPREDIPDGFPRAEFGLPIVFHFKDESLGEPKQTTLNPYVDGVVLERMSSPLILKPLALTNQKAVPLILRLTTKGIQQVELQDTEKNCLTPRRAVPVQGGSLAFSGSPLHGLIINGSALEAFLSFARQQDGFKEYTL